MRGDVKAHAAPIGGKVVRLLEGYGFVETTEGGEICFHRNSVPGGAFEKLKEGDEVRVVIAEKEGEQGPQASTVIPIGKHHIVG